MNILITILLCTLFVTCSHTQNDTSARLVGGFCEGCEAVFEYGKQILTSVDTLPDFNDNGQKIKLTGIIYEPDGITPAEDVILYIYHTNQEGIYPTKVDGTGWANRHGYLRGWIKTGSDGRYTFYTLKPGTYPSRSAPAHIHPVILETNGKYYWIEEFLFEGDPLITNNDSEKRSPRGGYNFILTLNEENDLFVGERNIILGKNVPDYD